MRTIDDGVYILRNKATRTYLELPGGNPAHATPMVGTRHKPQEESYYDQNWLIQYDNENEAYTLQNVRGGTFLDLRGGWEANGTLVQGCGKSEDPCFDNNQLWHIDGPAEDKTYRIFNKGTKASMEIGGGNSCNGAGVNVWETQDSNANQAWFLERRDRHGAHIEELLSDNPFIGQQFRPFKTNIAYLVCPSRVMEGLCEQRGISRRKKSKETYDCDDFAYCLKAAVSEWTNDNVKANVGVVCGIMYGTLTGGKRDAKYVYNWTPTHDWNSILFFEAETGKFLENIGYHAYLCLL